MAGVINLQLWQMAAAYIFIVILLFIVRVRGISREKEILTRNDDRTNLVWYISFNCY